MDKITFALTEQGIQITIPTDLLKHLAGNHPDNPLIVLDEKAFAEKVMFELEHNTGYDNDTGDTGFQELVDEACQEVYENGEDCVIAKGDEDE